MQDCISIDKISYSKEYIKEYSTEYISTHIPFLFYVEMNYFGTITSTITFILGLFYITEYMITE